MLLINRSVGSNDGGFDIAERRIDPFEGGGACRGSAGAGLDDLMRTPGVGYGTETRQAIPRVKPVGMR